MSYKKPIIFLIAILIIAVVVWLVYSSSLEKPKESASLTLAQAMEILNNNADYAEFLGTAKNFEPQLGNYFKLSPKEYEKIKPQWIEQGYEDRVSIVDAIKLAESTYWVELKNKNQGANLLTILDIESKECLLVMGSISIQAGVGL